MNSLYAKHAKLNLPTEDELLDLLKKLLQKFEQKYVIIDALDECGDVDGLFHQVIKVIHGWNLSHFHLFVTSRDQVDVIAGIEELNPQRISLSAELVQNDINSYIHSVTSQALRRWGHDVQQDIEKKLINNANGMYV